ncbi:MAG: hypothetical protein JJU42_07190 [Rhodobacteraceae bacterium]|nr:hypothetical protein [Paracoccaceae bacterium]
MGKQLIVVVHGVGVREAGVSTDMLSTALEPPHPDDPATAEASGASPRFRAVTSDDFHLREHPRHDRGGKAQVFPARLRRFHAVGADTPPHERVVADFFWGDIAEPRGGAPGLVLGFFRIAMGLGHAIRENARALFPDPHGLDRVLRRAASGAVLTLHGPVIGLNIVLLAGLLLNWLLARAGWPEAPVLWLLACAALAGGHVLLTRADAFLTRHTAGWLMLTGVLVVLMLLATVAGTPRWLEGLDTVLIDRSCALFSDVAVNHRCASGYDGVFLVGLRLYALLIGALAVAIGLILLVAAGSFWRWTQGQRAGVVDVTVPALGLMLLMWFLLISAIWGGVGYLGPDIIPEATHVTSALRGLLPAVLALGLLIAAALRVQVAKGALKRGFDPARYMDNPDALAERYRLIFCPWMLGALALFLTLLLWVGLHALGAGWLPCGEWLRARLANGTPAVLAAVAVVGGVLITTFRSAFAAGLGIATDVLAWINDHSWNSRDPALAGVGPERRHHSRTLVERALGLRADPPGDFTPRGYWLRRRIRERMNVLMTQLIADEAPDEIILVSHSQGTVIALEVLASEAAGWRVHRAKDIPIRLITMGSPYTHLYNTYFPASFPPPQARPVWRPRGTAPEAVLDDWVNLFRVDDFVGTHVDAPRHHATSPDRPWPREIPLPAGGHTNYWTDRAVARHLRRELAPGRAAPLAGAGVCD